MISGSDAVSAALAIGTLVAVGAKAVEVAYQEHKDKAMIEEAKAINQIHNTTMAKVTVHIRRVSKEVLSPPIFEFDEKTKLPKSIAMTPIFEAAIHDTIPVYRDAQSMRYSIPIGDAMSALEEWAFNRIHQRALSKGKPDDLTNAVLTYLIVMLSTHCYNVESQPIAQGYLEGMIKFIESYSFLNKKGESDRSDNLGKVHKLLLIAMNLLYQHSITTSYTQSFNEMVPALVGLSNKIIKSAASLIIPHEHHLLFRMNNDPNRIRDLTSFLTNQKISEGVIRYESKHSHTIFPQGELKFRRTPLFRWLQKVAKNANLAVKIDIDPEDKDDFILNDTFNTIFSRAEEKEIAALFRDSPNFLTLCATTKTGSQTAAWTVVSGSEFKNRIKIYYSIIMLINKINKLTYYTSYLANMVQQLGEIYFENPHHCVYIFKVLQGLNLQLGKDTADLLAALLKVEKSNNYLMPRPEHQKVLDDLKSWLHIINREIVAGITDLYDLHKKHPKVKEADFNCNTKGRPHKVLGLAQTLAEQAGINFPEMNKLKSVPSRRFSQTSLHKKPDSEESSESKSTLSTPPSPPTSPIIRKPVVVAAETKIESKETKESKESKDEIKAETPSQLRNTPRIEIPESVESLLSSIEDRIKQIEGEDEIYVDTYRRAHASLSSLNQRASVIEHDSALRRLKADRIQTLVRSLAADFKNFLSYDNMQQRQTHAYDLLLQIDSSLNRIDSAFLDVKKNKMNFFKTTSRKFADDFSESCHHIVGLRAV